MIYIKCSKCSDVLHSITVSESFSHCQRCNGLMKSIRIPDEQHRKAVSALQEYLDKLVTSSLEYVQEIRGETQLPEEYESWSANWLLKNSDARSPEGIGHVFGVMAAMGEDFQGDEIFDAADWAVITADAAEGAVSWFEEGNVYDMLWWLNNAIHAVEAVKGLSDYQTRENYYARKAEVMALLKENGYEVAI